ncbi:MAG: thioredoxin domain-containing protein [Deltaproteobacteria bacterium HGW-Deltaproteobacteria-6]|nr:MAG: thioredoxin domain-containing protein [Deltaproteobacteria bacterium HGW-Deltaproteobacteria-6]
MTYNRLKDEKSPYLLQHARNPVDWYPWGAEAFEKARREDKPVFLSIGYSTCHWCHVMERESFEDADVAELLNDTFVNIKVDREERPDIDAVYMKVCQIMTKSGGWPLTIMMTPDKKPFFAATYIPRETKYGRVGLLEMIPEVKTLWQTRREDVLSTSSEIIQLLKRPMTGNSRDVSEEILQRAYQSLLMSYDRAVGGFGHSPKFPTPHNFFFLLCCWKRTGEAQALQMVEHTLKNMRCGGIYDQIGFGFHRYSTDAQWIVPHFEKMLYDQALMAMAYTEIYQATGKKEYEMAAREIFTYVLRDMTDAQGGFYCAEDADSEGIEGKFYLWSENEIRSVLAKEDADLFLSHYRHMSDRSVQGMQEIPAGHFIPHLKPLSSGGTEDWLPELSGKMEAIRKKLFAVREKRVHPHKDDKILTDWNALMIAALARAAQVFDEPAYTGAALRAMNFIVQSLHTDEGRLLHRYREGQGSIAANIDDYSFMIWALLELYETTFETKHLFKALEYQSHLLAYFRDDQNGGFFFTSSDAEELLMRPKELYDGAIPSGNSIAFVNTLRLSRITGDVEMDERAHEVYRAFCGEADAMPTAFTQFLCGLDFAIGPASEVIIAGNLENSDTKSLLKVLRSHYVPNKIVVFRPESSAHPDIETIAPFVQSHASVNGQATAYVCSNFTCSLPTTDPQQMMELLNKK